MPRVREYHRPDRLPAALELLRRRSPRTVALAGGTWLTPRLGTEIRAEAVVDLSALGLDGIEDSATSIRLGAMTTLQAVMEDGACRSLVTGILSETARREAALNVRNAATVGGSVMVCPVESEFILALLALGAAVTIQTTETTTLPLSSFLARRETALESGLILHVTMDLPRDVAGGLARVARTPSDHAIVAAVAFATSDPALARIALGGVAARPLVIALEPGDDVPRAVADAVAGAAPYADLRGSAAYRQTMGPVTALRALDRAMANLAQRRRV